VEVAGYELSASIAQGLEAATLAPPQEAIRLEWLELSTRSDASLMPASSLALTAWTQEGCAVRSHLVHGPAFWQTTEIEDAPALLASTLAALRTPAAEVNEAAVAHAPTQPTATAP
jgi:hypothetical protein